MKKTLLASAAAIALAAGAVLPAQADTQSYTDPGQTSVDVYAQVDFEKDRYVNTFIYNDTDVLVLVVGQFKGHTGAESHAVVNQQNTGNYVDTAPDWEKKLIGHDWWGNPIYKWVVVPGGKNTVRASIRDSVNGNEGVTQLNQDVGYNVNQSNVLSAAVADNAFFADANASVQQNNQGNLLRGFRNTATARISGSVNDNLGVTSVNQNAGAMNNQNNTVALAVGNDATVALSEADLGQFNSNNTYNEVNPNRSSSISSSVSGNQGITTVNQSAGSMNNQSTTISVAGSVNF